MRLGITHLYFLVLMSIFAIRSHSADTQDIVQEKLIIFSNYRISFKDFSEILASPVQKPALDKLNIFSYEQYESWCDVNKAQWEEIRQQAFLSPEEFNYALKENKSFRTLADNGAIAPDYNWYIFKYYFVKTNGCACDPVDYYRKKGNYDGYVSYIKDILLRVSYKPIPECF